MSGDISGICFPLLRIHSFFLLLLVIGPLYSSSFNSDLVLVLFELVFHFFGLVAPLSSVYGGFIFLLLGPMSAKIFPILPWSQLSLLPNYIVDARCFVDYSIQFLGGVDHPGEKSCIFQKMLNQISNFQLIPSMVAKNVDA
jgi:hypothetical protein